MKQLFPYGRPVTGRDLVDRQEVVKEILSNLIGGQNIILASPRRYGKTSVVLEVLRRLRNEGFFTGYLDFFEKTGSREIAEGIVETVLANETSQARKILRLAGKGVQILLKNVQFKHVWQEHEIILSFGSREVDETRLLDDALDFPQNFAKKRQKRLFLAFDEFGELRSIDGALLKKLRAKFQRQDMVTYIFSGSQESLLRELFSHKAQAFYGFGRIVAVGPLPEKDVIDYLVRTFRRGEMLLKRELAVKTAQTVCFHPHYLKVLAQAILDLAKGEKEELEESDLKKGFDLALNRARGELDEEWASLGKAVLQRKVLKFLALEGKSPYSKENFVGIVKSKIYFALRELEKKGIIRKVDRGKYAFVNPFFPEYIRRMARGEIV